MLRILGIGLLIVVALPLAFAFPPLAVLAVGGWFLVARGKARSASAAPATMQPGMSWAPGTGWHPTELANHSRLRPRGRDRQDRRRGGAKWVPIMAILAILVILAGAARQPAMMLVALMLFGLVIAFQSRGRRSQQREPVAEVEPSFEATIVLPASARQFSMQTLSDTEFEQRVATLLHTHRYHSIQHVGQPGRQGIDIIARDQRGHLYLVQCQQYAQGNKAGSVDMQHLIDAVIRERAAGGIFVTTATYTQAAINLAQYSRVPIVLFDGTALLRVPAGPPLAWPAA